MAAGNTPYLETKPFREVATDARDGPLENHRDLTPACSTTKTQSSLSRRLLRSGVMRSYLRGKPIAVHFNYWFQWFYMYRKTDSQVITSVLVLYRASSALERSRLQTRSMHGV